MPDNLYIPVLQEEAHVSKRALETERVSVRTFTEYEHVTVSDEVRRERVEVTRIPAGHVVSEAPGVRTEGDLTIVPVLEERLVVEKRLFLIEELHVRRTTTTEPIELPATLRRTRVEVERTEIDQQEEN